MINLTIEDICQTLPATKEKGIIFINKHELQQDLTTYWNLLSHQGTQSEQTREHLSKMQEKYDKHIFPYTNNYINIIDAFSEVKKMYLVAPLALEILIEVHNHINPEQKIELPSALQKWYEELRKITARKNNPNNYS